MYKVQIISKSVSGNFRLTKRCHAEIYHMTSAQIDAEVKMSLEKTSVDTIKDFSGWNENLATASEAIVKAELASKRSMKELQKETIEILKKKEIAKEFPMD